MEKNRGKVRCILITILMLGVAILENAMTVNAAMSKSAQHKLYKKTMRNYAVKAKASYKKNSPYGGLDAASKKVLYLFVDIDKNGTDELVMRYGQDRDTAVAIGYGESTSIYTIKNGKVITVLDNTNIQPLCHDKFVRIYKNRSRINMGYTHGYKDNIFCKYSNGIINQSKNVIRLALISENGRTWGSYNFKKISPSTYYSKYKRLTNNEKGYIMKIYK